MAKNLPKEVLQAATIEGELIMTDSKKNYVPVDLGTLRNSGIVLSLLNERTGKIAISLSYGGPASPYALAVHEHLSEHSPPSWRKAQKVTFHPQNRGPKYLERPLFKAKPKMAQRMNERIQKKIEDIAKE